jgi:hypothetical protein
MAGRIGKDAGSVRRTQRETKRIQLIKSSFDRGNWCRLPHRPAKSNLPGTLAGKNRVFAGKFDRSNAQALGDENDVANLQDGVAEALPFIDPQDREFWINLKRQAANMRHAIGTESKSTHMHSLLPAKHPSVPTVTPTKPTFGDPIQEIPVGHYRL